MNNDKRQSSKRRRNKPIPMWGLFNYRTLLSVWYSRRRANEEGANVCLRGAEEFATLKKTGAMRVSKVVVREVE